MSITIRRTLTAVVAAGAATAVLAAPASAHVTVSSPDAAPGGYGKLVFRVPNESDTAATTKLQVTLPTDAPFASVSTKPHPGWEVRVDEAKLPEPVEVGDVTLTDAVRTVTWTAEGPGIEPGMFDEFELSVGPFSEDVTTLMFPAVQTYSDGEVVRWSQPTPEGGAEPEHPAPMLDLAGQSADSGHSDDAAEETGDATEEADMEVTSAESEASTDGTDDDSDPMARTLGAVGLLVGVAALTSSLLLRRRREGGD
jgi:periplasmic copper chaperone A